jgi:hypothetical protein
MFELPELFGSPYVLPAIIVVVVLLLLLLLLSVSRRRRAGSAGKSDRPATAASASRTAATAPAAAIKARESSDRARGANAKTGPYITPSEGDPIAGVVRSILQGWGDLTAEDTNRLRIFRSDKVVAAISAAELPKNLKNAEHARTRLTQLRHFASSLQESPASSQETRPEAVATTEVPPAGDEVVPAGTTSDAGEGTSASSEKTGAEDTTETTWGVEKTAVLTSTAGATASWYSASVAGDAPSDVGEADKDEAASAAAALEVASRDALQIPSEEGTLEEAEAFVEEEVEEAEIFAEERSKEAEAVVEEEINLLEETTIEEELPKTGAAPVAEEPPEPGEPAAAEKVAGAGGFFSGLRASVSTAHDIMALPADEQVGMLAFLHPSELGKVFQATGDAELKKSVIDTLEHIGNTSSLDIIHNCLDDPDPEIQVYALDAADRLLGVN